MLTVSLSKNVLMDLQSIMHQQYIFRAFLVAQW